MKNRIFLTFLILFCCSNAVYSVPLAVKSAVVKFSFAMLGVVISSVAIWLGLLIYNKIRDNLSESSVQVEDEGLKTPKNKDNAINFYIRKNRLR